MERNILSFSPPGSRFFCTSSNAWFLCTGGESVSAASDSTTVVGDLFCDAGMQADPVQRNGLEGKNFVEILAVSVGVQQRFARLDYCPQYLYRRARISCLYFRSSHSHHN